MLFALSGLLLSASVEPTIVVTAPRATDAALEACLARRCGTRDDAVASIQHAQAQFADGQYPAARKTLRASLHRHQGATAQDPRAISALWHALARVTLHNGDVEEYRRAAMRSATILANATSVTPQERQMGEMQIGDAMAATGDSDGAARHYRRVGKMAADQGDIELEQLMTLRAIYARSGIHGRSAVRSALAREMEKSGLTPHARTVALALTAQLQDKDASAAVGKLDDVPVQAGDAPTLLLWTPKDKLTEQREAIARALANNDSTLLRILMPRSSEVRPYHWADIGFWIRPSGRVEGARMLRGKADESWAKDVVKLVQGRRYAPFEAEPGAEGRYKIERVTLTYDHMTPGGSLIRRRSGLPSYQFEELKAEERVGM
ncbi:MAG: hypothetical protein DCF31_08075 [Alphaproteobacteria bacterium]|nr:MAG: hypothetical protein DCF31_08075 [Alphaproteobacteria bacterium]